MKTKFSELGLLCGNAFRSAEPVLITRLQCERYPLVHEPDWGNLICVPVGSVVEFGNNLRRYLVALEEPGRPARLRGFLGKIPGLAVACRALVKN